MSAIDTEALILEAVTEHYREHDLPFYLADLGQLLRDRGIEIPSGLQLKDYLASRFHGQLAVVQDHETPARIAVATPANQEKVRKRLSRRRSSPREDSGIAFDRVSNALVAAFCKIPPPNTELYFRVVPPFRFDTFMYPPGDSYTSIGDEYRPSEFAGRSANSLTDGERQIIFGYIEKWADANSIDMESLYYDTGRRFTHKQRQLNALERLIDAQEPEFRPRMKIPGDVALILMRHN